MDESHSLIEGGPEPLARPNGGLSSESPNVPSDTRPSTPLESTPSDQAGSRPQRSVPYGALAEERARRKELQRELQSATEAQQRLQERLDHLHGLAQQGAPSPEAGGATVPEASELQLESSVEATPNSEARVKAEAAFRTQVMQSVRDVMRGRPDFLAAYQHARQARISELCALGYAPQEALSITFDNELEVIQNAYAKGRNPAEVIYDYAQRRGFQGAAPASAPNGPPASSPRGVMSEAEKIALAARGQAASKSLSAAGGGPSGTLTLEALAGMSDEEFAEATKGDRWQKLLTS